MPEPESTSTPSSQAVAVPPKQVHSAHWLRHFLLFLVWVLTGFGLLGWLLGKHKRVKGEGEEIVLYSIHNAFFLWGLIATGFIGSAVVHRFEHANKVLGWIWVGVLIYTVVILLFDLNLWKLLAWVGVFAFIWLISKYIEDVKHFRVLSPVFRHMRELHPTFDPGTATVMSWVLLIPWIGSLFYSYTHGQKRFSYNSIEEWQLGVGSEVVDRSGLKFHTRYRDVLESLLGFGCGDVEAYDQYGKVIKCYPNVLGLYFIWSRLDLMMHQRAALVDNMPDEPMDVHPEAAPPKKEESKEESQ